MKSLYTFEDTERLSDAYPVPALRVHAAAGCGRGFRDVAALLEPDSENPCLVLSRPLGLNGVRAILDAYKARQRAAVRQADEWAAANPGAVMRAEREDYEASLTDGRRGGKKNATS